MTGAAVFLAFTSALCFGVALVLTHIGLRYIAPLPGAAISTAAPDVPADDLAAAHRVRAAAAPDAFLRVQEKNKLLRAEYAVADFIVACVVAHISACPCTPALQQPHSCLRLLGNAPQCLHSEKAMSHQCRHSRL
jgi:hypothetical protein